MKITPLRVYDTASQAKVTKRRLEFKMVKYSNDWYKSYKWSYKFNIAYWENMKPKDCFNCEQSKSTGSCTIFFCELLQKKVWGYSTDKDCPLQD